MSKSNAEAIINASSLSAEEKNILIKAIDESSTHAKIDIYTIRLIIIILGVILAVTVIFACYMGFAGQTQDIPDMIIAISSASVGALAGLIGFTKNR